MIPYVLHVHSAKKVKMVRGSFSLSIILLQLFRGGKTSSVEKKKGRTIAKQRALMMYGMGMKCISLLTLPFNP